MKAIKIMILLLLVAATVQAQSYKRLRKTILTSSETYFFPVCPSACLAHPVPFEGNNGFMGYTFFSGEGFMSRLPFSDPLSVANMVPGVNFDRQVTVIDPGNIHSVNQVAPGTVKLPDNYYAPLGPVVDKK